MAYSPDIRYMYYEAHSDTMICHRTGYRMPRREFERVRDMEQRGIMAMQQSQYYPEPWMYPGQMAQAAQVSGQTPTPNAVPAGKKPNKLLLVHNRRLKHGK